MKTVLITAIVTFCIAFGATAQRFIPSNPKSNTVQERQAQLQAVYASFTQADRIKVKRINHDYKQLIEAEAARGFNAETSQRIEQLKQQRFREILRQVSPGAKKRILEIAGWDKNQTNESQFFVVGR